MDLQKRAMVIKIFGHHEWDPKKDIRGKQVPPELPHGTTKGKKDRKRKLCNEHSTRGEVENL